MSNHYDDEPVDLQEILKRIAPWFGLGLAIISIYFSYDGLDQSISGGNPNYTEIAKYIGWVMAIAVTLIQFIFNTDFAKLSPTLRVVGIVSYIYSLYTNYIGMEHLFGFSGIIGGAIAVFMDVTPEALIAWALEEETQGDLLGNVGKWFTGRSGGRRRRPNQSKQYTLVSEQKHQDTQPKMPSFAPQGKHTQGQGSKRREFLEQRGKSEKETPNKFFGE
jgi:hypothetical protein